MSKGFEVDPEALRAARTSYQGQALVVRTIASRFEAMPYLTPDAFGNIPDCSIYANSWAEIRNQIRADLKTIAESLESCGDAVNGCADNYDRLEEANTVRVKDGDTLWGIAGREDVYDDPTQWPRIADPEVNPEIVDPDLIHPGDVINIPLRAP